MCSRFVTAEVGKIEVLCNQQSRPSLHGKPDRIVDAPRHPFLRNRVGVMPDSAKEVDEFRRQVLVNFDAHAYTGTPGAGRSSIVAAAA